MTFNRIAIYGHRGWVSSEIVESLAASGAFIRVLYRPGSDVSTLPKNVEAVEVDVTDHETLVTSLQGIDILISLVGHSGVTLQHHFIKAIPETEVKLFSPSDLAGRYDYQGNCIPVNNQKQEVEAAARSAGIPITIVLPGNFAEYALATPAMGISIKDNKLLFTGNCKTEPMNICTRSYVAAAYRSIFATTPPKGLENRAIGLSEIRPTGNDIFEALALKHRTPPSTASVSTEKVSKEIDVLLQEGKPIALAFYCRKIWGTGQQAKMIGTDIWEVPGYQKVTLTELLVDGKLENYRDMPVIIGETLLSVLASNGL